jgi:leucyl aminopeptidase
VPFYLPEPLRLDATHHARRLAEQDIASFDHLFVMLPADAADGGPWPAFAWSDHLRRLAGRLRDAGEESIVHAVLPDDRATAVTLGFCRTDADTFRFLTSARRIVTPARKHRLHRVAVMAPGFGAAAERAALRALVSALAVSASPMPSNKRESGRESSVRLQHIDAFGTCDAPDFARVLAEAEGNGLARWLATLPANELTVTGYVDRISTLAERNGWHISVFGEADLAEAGAGAFLAVSRGSDGNLPASPALVHLQYRPAGTTPEDRAELSLVGKGICFDTGGVNVKPVQYMQTMNEDMQGSAVALGTMQAITRLELPVAVDAWLALAENTIGPKAFKPQDVVTAVDGTTIEIVHTDAEGRLVLADTLCLAASEMPALIVDLATLTGACVNALTTACSGVFTNHPDLHEMLVEAGRTSGERVWPFPLHEDFDQALESDVADVKQCAVEGRGDHLLAARFLQRFVPEDLPWVHVDLSASRHKGGLADIPTDVTGFGVRFVTSLVLDQLLSDTVD